MLRIQRSSNGTTVFSLSGKIERQDIPELCRLVNSETDREIALDLLDVMLVDRDAVEFLVHCEAEKIKLENCPGYIRHWMNAGRAAPKSGE